MIGTLLGNGRCSGVEVSVQDCRVCGCVHNVGELPNGRVRKGKREG